MIKILICRFVLVVDCERKNMWPVLVSLNAAMLLATKATPSYTVDAWSTPDHNELTNAYIMAYGDGVR
jgi:hypothetical protein